MSALIFGSIGTLADTSELQREAFNAAFAEHDLDWSWSQAEYRDLLRDSGGEQRVAAYAAARGQQVDAGAIHHRKSEIFQERLRTGDVSPRAGLVQTVADSRAAGLKLALVTTTAPENVDALTGALAPELDLNDFDLVVTVEHIDEPKPDPAAYRYALTHLHERAGDCVAVEDNLGGVTAATDAGIACVAFPGVNNAGHDFSAASRRVDQLSFDELRELLDTPGARG